MGEHEIVDELRVIVSDGTRDVVFHVLSQMRPSLRRFWIYGPKNGLILDHDQETLIAVRGERLKSYAEKFVPPVEFAMQHITEPDDQSQDLRGRRLPHEIGDEAPDRIVPYGSVANGTELPLSPYREILLTADIMDLIFEQLANRDVVRDRGWQAERASAAVPALERLGRQPCQASLVSVTRLPPPQAKAELVEMMRVMRHEPFYVLRTWMDETLGLYLGWSARQGSFSDAGPHLNETGDVVLVFSGEDYPEPGTRQRLKEQGHTIGDAEASYIVHQHEEDPSFPANLNGRFHGVLIDRRRGSALLFNDRYGMNRVYVHECPDGTYFAAEAKAILAARPELRTIDARALAESITLGCVVENRTLFSGIQVLPGGSAWTFQGGRLCRKGSYFNPHEWEDQPTLDSETFYERTREVFSRTLPRYFAGRERVGVSLTGGLDSRMVMAWQPCAPGTLPSYTWGGPYRDCRDVIVAREVARTCGQTHEVISMGQEFLAGFASHADPRDLPDRRMRGHRAGAGRLHEPARTADCASADDRPLWR